MPFELNAIADWLKTEQISLTQRIFNSIFYLVKSIEYSNLLIVDNLGVAHEDLYRSVI